MFNLLSLISGVLMIVIVLWETFETIVLPRRVTRHFRLTRFFYRFTWITWRSMAGCRRTKKKRDALMSYYGPLSLLMLFAFFAVVMVFGFALVQYGDGARFAGSLLASRFGNCLYMSGTTLFTLGLGDITPVTPVGRFVTVVEAGLGFGYLALVIGYLPVLYQAFSRREVTISLLDARAGSPPTAFELLRRHSGPSDAGLDALTTLLRDWEHWAADVMESHLSYPVLAYFRSQHDNQSWIGSLVAVVDVCALAMVGLEGMCQYQARMTFAIARHALVDLSQVFYAPPDQDGSNSRLTQQDLEAIRRQLREAGTTLTSGATADAELLRIRGLYEPYAIALARHLRLDLPPWIKREAVKDNWQTSAWQHSQSNQLVGVTDDHH